MSASPTHMVLLSGFEKITDSCARLQLLKQPCQFGSNLQRREKCYEYPASKKSRALGCRVVGRMLY